MLCIIIDAELTTKMNKAQKYNFNSIIVIDNNSKQGLKIQFLMLYGIYCSIHYALFIIEMF